MDNKIGRIAVLWATALVVPSCLEDQSEIIVPLPAPSNLTGVAASDGTSIELAWRDNSSGETGFRIDVAPVPIVSDNDVTHYALVGPDVTSYSYPALPNITRFFRVLAIAASRQSAPSNVISVTTPDVPLRPSEFDALVGPDGTDLNVVLSWNDLANETGYALERSADGSTWQGLASLGTNTTTFTDRGTALGMDYRYRIRGSNSNGSGAWSVIARAQTRDPNWSTISSSASGDVSWNISVAGPLHLLLREPASVTCYDATHGRLIYGTAGSTSITTSEVDPGFPAILGLSGTSHVLDVRGYPHFAANDSLGGALYYLFNAAGSWTATPIAATAETDRAILRMGSENTPHIVFQTTAGSKTRLRHAWKEGSTWQVEETLGDDAPDFFGFAVDSADGLHVSYRRPAGPGAYELVYLAKQSGNPWSSAVIPTAGSVEFSSIAIDGAGAVHIVYNELTTAGLHHTTNATGRWVGEVVHQSPRGSWGRFNSTVIERAAGRIHIAYYDSVGANLRYAEKQFGGEWTYSLVDGIGDVGRYCAMGLSWSQLLIAYGDASTGQVKLARKPNQ
jgi:hypothetical protein